MPKGVYERTPELQRFWGKVEVKEEAECWLWKGGLDTDGYGYFSLLSDTAGDKPKRQANRTIFAHRYSALLKFKEIEEGLLVRHTCDTRACVNPAHLILGTAKDNSNDMIERNRSLVGEKCPSSTMTDVIALSILKEYKSECENGKRYGVHLRLAEKYKIPFQIISRLTARKTYRHLEVV